MTTELLLWIAMWWLWMWGIVEAFDIWYHRPAVMFSEELQRWVAAPRDVCCQRDEPLHADPFPQRTRSYQEVS